MAVSDISTITFGSNQFNLKDPSKQVKITAAGLLKADGYGNVRAAEAGADYIVPSALSPFYNASTASTNEIGETVFYAEAAGLPIKDIIVSIKYKQYGSGTPSPSNLWRIIGFDDALIFHVDSSGTESYTTTIPLPTIVYRGTLNPIKGELIVDMAEIDMGNITWTEQTIGSVSAFQGDFGTNNIRGDKAKDDSYLCSCYRFINDTRQALESVNYAFTPYNKTNSYKLALRDDRYSTAAELTAAITGQKLVYELKNPITYHLAPIEFVTFSGTNMMYAECGDVTVAYGAHIAAANEHTDRVNESLLSLMACIAPIENGERTSQAYAQGAYFFHAGNFCKAKTAIASGATFTLNTNYEYATVDAELSDCASLGITGASVGQVLTVAAVNANGKPTAFSTTTLLSAAGVSF